ncbi:MAG: hypothetical protein KatS3mg115_0158 [Candidatus Poribacteria bacterium]|nr:MAG: hypothetical protein KatS3mg115_0158 [Candidatus Poribacteria bacterium]
MGRASVFLLIGLMIGVLGATERPLSERLPPLPQVSMESLPRSIRELVEKTAAARPPLRSDYAKLLATAGEDGVRGLVALLRAGDVSLRWEVVSALGRAKDSPLARTAVLATLRDPEWSVRGEAALALGRIGTAEDLPLLRELAALDESSTVRLAAVRGMEALQRRLATGRVPEETLQSAAVPPEASPMMGTTTAPPQVSESADTTPSMAPPTAPTPQPLARPEEVSLMPGGAFPARPQGPDSLGDVSRETVRRAADRIDAYIDARLRAVGLEASPQASDGEFLRRVWLDLTGTIPPAEVAAEFVLQGGGGKREKLIDELVGSEEYLDHWSGVWLQWLTGTLQETRETARLRAWLRQALAQNMPYDEMVRRLLTAQGPSQEDGAANYFLRYDVNPVELTAWTSRTFLGLPLQCAQCHDHKSEPWKQTQFYSVVAFFESVRQERIEQEVTDENGRTRREYIGSWLRDRPVRPVSVPDKGITVAPAFLDGTPYTPRPGQTAREAYAEWLTRPDNPYFAKALVNRMWAYFTGRGFVEPVDWFGVNNPPTHPELLEWLAQDFVAHQYDLRYLTRAILYTRAYQRSAQTTEQNKNDRLYLSHARIRPLTAEQLFNALLDATQIESRAKRRQQDFETLRRQYLQRFRFVFGNDEMNEEELQSATISQALLMLNGPLTNQGSLSREGTRLARILERNAAENQRVEAIFLATLSRLPTAKERSYFRNYLRSSGYRDKNKAYEDLYWALLNSAEFASNH